MRIRSSFCQWIKNSLNKHAKKKILLKKDLFRYAYHDNSGCEDDGTTKLRIIFDKFDPIAISGLNNIKARLSEFKLVHHNQDVPEILEELLVTFNKIVMTGGQDEDSMLKICNLLYTSNDEDYLDFVKEKRDACEEDRIQDDVDVLIDECIKNITTSLAKDPLRRACKFAIMKIRVNQNS